MKGVFEADFHEWRDEVDSSLVKLKAFEGGTKTVNDSLSRLQTSLSGFDSVLSSLGFRFGTAIRGLEEISTAAGKSARELGAVTTAGLGFGALMAGIDFGRWVAGLAGTDKIIGDVTAKLLGFGDVAGQVAGANADILARASENAGRAITDLNEAMTINAAQAQANATHWANVAKQEKAAAVEFDRLKRFIEEGSKTFDAFNKQRAADDEKTAAENKRGMEDFERGLLREFDLELKVWTDGIRLTDQLNASMQKKLELQTAFVTQLTLERAQAVDANTARNLGPGVSDPAAVASARRDQALADIEAKRARAPDFDFGPIIQKIWQDFDEQILKRGAAAVAATPPVQVNVSGIMDPRTIDEITDAIMRRSGRLWPGR